MGKGDHVGRMGGAIDGQVGGRDVGERKVPELVGAAGAGENGGAMEGDIDSGCGEEGGAAGIAELADTEERGVAQGGKEMSRAGRCWEGREME